jgi:isopenicillin N synthase-like dioxygenase
LYLDRDTQRAIHGQSRAFFDSPIEEKIAIENVAGPNPQRGWSPIGAENTAKLYSKGFLSENVAAGLKDARVRATPCPFRT